jgi:hypothetical protein
VLLDRDSAPFPTQRVDLVASDKARADALWQSTVEARYNGSFVARPNFPSTVEAASPAFRTACFDAAGIARGLIHIGDPEDVKFVRSIIAGRRWDAPCGMI